MFLWIHMNVKSEVTQTFVLRRSSWRGGTRWWRTHFCGSCWFCTCVFAPQRFCLRRNLSFIKSWRPNLFTEERRTLSISTDYITYCHFNSFQCCILINTLTQHVTSVLFTTSSSFSTSFISTVTSTYFKILCLNYHFNIFQNVHCKYCKKLKWQLK